MCDEPINSIYQAKKYFKSMGCLHFHMAREYPQRYEEYKKLNISKQTEAEWKIERFNEYYDNVIVNNNNAPLWIVLSNMAELVETLKTTTELKRLLELTKLFQHKIPVIDRVIISESINGREDRRYRSGLIYLAYDLNNILIAKDFVELSLFFAIYEEGKSRDFDRCKRSAKLCLKIKSELRL